MQGRVWAGVVMLALVVAATEARAQEQRAAARPGEHGFAGFLALGAERASWTGLNGLLASYGYDAVPERHATLGVGAYSLRSHVLVGAEMYGTMGRSVTASSGRVVTPMEGSGFLTLGYAVVDRPRARAYPLVGLGFATLRMQLEDVMSGVGIGPDVNNPTFEQVVADPGHRARLSATGLALHAGVGYEVLFTRHLRAARRREAGLLLGIRAGYTLTPVRTSWRLYDEKVSGGPDDVGGGWYVRFTVGNGGTRWRRGG